MNETYKQWMLYLISKNRSDNLEEPNAEGRIILDLFFM
jgi:hypothetical protein